MQSRLKSFFKANWLPAPKGLLRTLRSPVRTRHLWLPSLFLLFCIYRNQELESLGSLEAVLGLAICVLSFVPLLVWASKDEWEPPAFQCFFLVMFPYYGYPIISSKQQYMRYPDEAR